MVDVSRALSFSCYPNDLHMGIKCHDVWADCVLWFFTEYSLVFVHCHMSNLVVLWVQHRTAQETLAYKDDQLREAQAWVQRAQELDAFYANTHNSLHAELRDRNEQINQLWLGQQRQVSEN